MSDGERTQQGGAHGPRRCHPAPSRPRLGKRGLILAAKLAARELGPIVIAHDGGLWDTDRISSDEDWLEFGRFVRERVDRLG